MTMDDVWTVGDLRDALAGIDRETPVVFSLLASRLDVSVECLDISQVDGKDYLVIGVTT